MSKSELSPLDTPMVALLSERLAREREMREMLERLLNERDRRYEDRFKAQEVASLAALTAQERLTNSAFNASEKAISKAEAAQNAHNTLANGLQGRLDQQAKDFIARPEFTQRMAATDAKIDEVKSDISTLRESRSQVTGREQGLDLAKSQATWFKGAVLTSVLALLGIAVTVILFALKYKSVAP